MRRRALHITNCTTAALVLSLLLAAAPAGAAPDVPFGGYLVLDGQDDIAAAQIPASAQDEATIEALLFLESGSSSPADRLEIAATNTWSLYVTRYTLGGTRTGCVGYLGPGGWEHCRTSTMGLNVWHHVAFVVKDGQGQLFLNGELFGNSRPVSPPPLLGVLTVGRNLDGRMDEVRLSRLARYAADFDVPAEKFQCDAETMALWGFDEPHGSTAFNDRCGGPTLVGQNGVHSEGGAILAAQVYLPLMLR